MTACTAVIISCVVLVLEFVLLGSAVVDAGRLLATGIAVSVEVVALPLRLCFSTCRMFCMKFDPLFTCFVSPLTLLFAYAPSLVDMILWGDGCIYDQLLKPETLLIVLMKISRWKVLSHT
jgi:hypothetical protein